MHLLICALVEASTEDEALWIGRKVFDRLVDPAPLASPLFDYYVTFDEEDSPGSAMAGLDDPPAAAPVESEAGQKLLDRAWEATKAEFQRNLDHVKEGLEELSEEEIMRDEDLVRHSFHLVGAYEGPSIRLYDQHGLGIRHRGDLDRVLDEFDEVWIVPAEVHI